MASYYFTCCFLFLTLSLNAQTVNIFIHSSFSGFPDATAINTTYTNIGFSSVNITSSVVDATLTTANYQVAYIVEYYNYSTASPVFLTNTQRQVLEDFISDGGHVVWIAESIDNYISSSVTPPVNANAITTINSIYGTSLSYGPFFNNGGMGSPNMPRIHPSSGPGGLSQQTSVLSSGSYATLLNVPAESKVYTSDFFDNFTFFDACTHTTLALFPAYPTATDGTVIISTELGLPFHSTSTGPFGGPPFVFNTGLDDGIANLHFRLLTNTSMTTINSWANIATNTNPNCPPTTLLPLNFLLNFDVVTTQKQAVRLNWTIKNEHTIQLFTVEHSPNGIDWTPINTQLVTDLEHYNALDQDPFLGISYYRLKLVSHNEDIYYSAIKAINLEQENGSKLLLYPQPVLTTLTVENAVLTPQNWSLWTMTGKEIPLLFLDQRKNSVVIDFSHLSAGVYFLKTSFGTKKIHKH
ncbi:T9SS type A sorting domain-containing protein [Aureispira anguillae]|uniref:T9SS type A sorting domain-containing protein n=1 Tax=Aureispira anguillae TaxID=2864201 RepID=A0A915YBE2_9BACT|nr:T9SS type A sorting domain-containing protein [Aureispira anguillae]BDS09982.1 T9SS type A sorting domain-containing protein [Aureispira anguillae]